MKKFTASHYLTLALPILSIGASQSLAAQDHRFYLEATVGATFANGDYSNQIKQGVSQALTIATAALDTTGTAGASLAFGWKATPHFAIEAGYVDFGRHRTSATGGVAPTASSPASREKLDGRYRVSAVTLDAVGYWPINTAITVSGRVGVAATEQKYSVERTSTWDAGSRTWSSTFPSNRQTRLHWGIGASYALNNRTSLVANFTRIESVGDPYGAGMRPTSNGKFDYGLLGIGLRYSF